MNSREAFRLLHRALHGVPAGPDRAKAQEALRWLEVEHEELRRRARAEDDTKEVPTP